MITFLKMLTGGFPIMAIVIIVLLVIILLTMNIIYTSNSRYTLIDSNELENTYSSSEVEDILIEFQKSDTNLFKIKRFDNDLKSEALIKEWFMLHYPKTK